MINKKIANRADLLLFVFILVVVGYVIVSVIANFSIFNIASGLLGIGFVFVAIKLGFYHKYNANEAQVGPDLTAETTSYIFPITLGIVDRVISNGDSSITFLQKCTIQANKSLREVFESQWKCYFEIKILELGKDANLYIGLTDKDENMLAIPGGISIEANRGDVYGDNELFKLEGVSNFTTSDCIGILIGKDATDPTSNNYEVTFIKNGLVLQSFEFIPKLDSDGKINITPTLHSTGLCQIIYNFGQENFLYGPGNSNLIRISNLYTINEFPPSYNTNNNDVNPLVTIIDFPIEPEPIPEYSQRPIST